jgi:hypothetical protein
MEVDLSQYRAVSFKTCAPQLRQKLSASSSTVSAFLIIAGINLAPS